MDRVGVGIIGCGIISAAYLKAARLFPDRGPGRRRSRPRAAAEARGAEFGPPAHDSSCSPILPWTSCSTSPSRRPCRGGAAGDRRRQARLCREAARRDAEARRLLERGAAPGCASAARPTPFSAARHQSAAAARRGAIGTPVGGTAFFMCRATSAGIRTPTSTTRAGGGPMLDMGPYYVTDLVKLLGPVAEVVAFAASRARPRDRQGPRAARDRGRGARATSPAAAVRAGGDRADRDQLRGGRTSTRRSSCTAPRARSRCPTRTASAARSSCARAAPGEDGADQARLCRRQLSHHRRRRHGARDRDGRPHRASGALASTCSR